MPGVLVVESRLLKYRQGAVAALEEALKSLEAWKLAGGRSRPAIHIPIYFGLERDAEPSAMQ